jgi:hypothetical protein
MCLVRKSWWDIIRLGEGLPDEIRWIRSQATIKNNEAYGS